MKHLFYQPPQVQVKNRLNRPNFFKSFVTNIDDSVDGLSEWKPELTGWKRRVQWWLRNPFHDLTFYWIGLVGLRTEVEATNPGHVFAHDDQGEERGGWNNGWVRGVDDNNEPLTMWLPYVSYADGKIQFYMGWRTPNGSLGFKLRKTTQK